MLPVIHLTPSLVWPAVNGRIFVTSLILCGTPFERHGPEPTDCLSAEIARRTVRIETRRGWCSGVIVEPRVIRTAAHCFQNDRLKRVWTRDRVEFKANFRYTYRLTRVFDQAEIFADRDLIDVESLPIVKIHPTDQLRGVIVVGYPGNGPLVRHAAVVVAEPRGRSGSFDEFEYKVAAEDRWRARPGASGGPTFSPLGCQLRLVGTNEAYGLAYTYIQNVRPINDSLRKRRTAPGLHYGVALNAD